MQLLELSSATEHFNPFCKHANTWQGAIYRAVLHNEMLVTDCEMMGRFAFQPQAQTHHISGSSHRKAFMNN